MVLSTQHQPGVTHKQIEEAVIEQIIKPVLPKELVKGAINYLVNPTGTFEIGGPKGDCGLTGHKIIVEAYGHFGRDEPEFTWEATDKAKALAADAGLKAPAMA